MSLFDQSGSGERQPLVSGPPEHSVRRQGDQQTHVEAGGARLEKRKKASHVPEGQQEDCDRVQLAGVAGESGGVVRRGRSWAQANNKVNFWREW